MAKFKNSPLTQFITEPPKPTAPEVAKKTTARKRTDADRARIAAENAQYKANPQWNTRAAMDSSEPRSRRVQLLMKPSIYNALLDIASTNAQSVNNLIETALQQFIEDNQQ